jgi:hypothetical protein
MWTAEFQTLTNSNSTACRVLSASVGGAASPIAFSEVIKRWQTDDTFTAWFTSILAGSPLDAFRFETPPITPSSLSRPFECVLLEGPALGQYADPTAFIAHFRAAPQQPIVAFPSLGKDAFLIAPAPLAAHDVYPHLASFLRRAPSHQVRELWRTVGTSIATRLPAHAPLWLSTAGLGVPWLHVRLDAKPKYFRHAPYRVSPA